MYTCHMTVYWAKEKVICNENIFSSKTMQYLFDLSFHDYNKSLWVQKKVNDYCEEYKRVHTVTLTEFHMDL